MSPGKSVLKGKKKVFFSPERTAKPLGNKLVKSSTDKPAKFSADSKIEALDQKWSERFNRLKALFWPKLTFQTVKMHFPPVGVVRLTEPFIQPVD